MATQSDSNDNNPKQNKQKKSWQPKFDYKVDYNDHFETPLNAYHDILPLLDAVQQGRNNERRQHIVYDPYYCNGRTAVYLRQLGFEQVVHAKRDFYKDISQQRVPRYETLITNPPYSDTHKEKCLEFCTQQFLEHQRPFFLLMPNYVAARSYYRRILGEVLKDVAYLIPSKPYEYDHPEGTGHEISPFASLWFCGVGRDQIQTYQKHFAQQQPASTHSPIFVTSVEELEARRAIPTEKRPNPRQRKKRKAAMMAAAQGCISPAAATTTEASPAAKHNKKANSRHRDKTGKRIKKRF